MHMRVFQLYSKTIQRLPVSVYFVGLKKRVGVGFGGVYFQRKFLRANSFMLEFMCIEL